VTPSVRRTGPVRKDAVELPSEHVRSGTVASKQQKGLGNEGKVQAMTELGDLSWRELVEELRALRRSKRGDLATEDFVGVLHELQVHQVELEMQNRELREVQERLEASRARYAELYDRAPVGYATLNKHGVIVEINLTGATLLGRERDQLVGLPFAVVAVQDAQAFLSHLRFSATNEVAATTTDIEVKHGTRKVILQLTTTPDFSEALGIAGYRTMMSDVTERRRIEAANDLLEDERRAREAADAENHMKDQFLGIVSHELRTPLNAMMGWTQILSRHMCEPDLIARGLQVMQRNGQGLARIVDDILDVSRIVSGKLRVEMKKADMREVVQGAIDQVRPLAQGKRILLRESLSDSCFVRGDALRLQQVVSNLLSNAIKFTKEVGCVEVTLEPHDHGVRVVVRDNGCGIDAADLPYIFEHFRQADSTTTRTHAGLGLGLAIARHIVSAHGGTIDAASEGRGRGAVFTVYLPPSQTLSAPPSPRRDLRGTRSDITGTKVLCVDDDRDALELMAVILGTFGAAVQTSATVDDAIARVSSFVPDVIVSDLAMPERDGYEFIGRLRAMSRPWSDIPTIALTAYARADDAGKALSAGFTRHLAKPVDPELLADTISALAQPS